MKYDRIQTFELPAERTRYQGEKGVNPIALTMVVLITAALIFALTAYRDGPQAQRVENRIEVVNLEMTPPPPPPPAPPPPETPPPPPTAAVIPPPRVPTPAPNAPQIQAQAIPTPPSPATSFEPAPPAPSPAPAPAPAPASVTAGDISTSVIHAPPPRYPRESRRLREQGVVILGLVLATDGTVMDIRVSKSSGHRRLDDAALSAVRSWRWRPTVRQGNEVQVRGSVEIPFVLTG